MAVFTKVHGLRLAQNGFIQNLVVENLTVDPSSLEAGRSWYNTADKQYKFATLDANGSVVVRTFATKEAFDDFVSDLASTNAAKGAALIGYVGATGTNSKFSVSAGTVKEALDSVVSSVDAEIQNRIDDISDVNDSIDNLSTNTSTNYLSKTGTTDQTVASVVRFLNDIRIDGNFTFTGAAMEVQSEVVKIADNILTLNSNVISGTATENAGLSVMRGDAGEQLFIQWNETEGQVEIAVTKQDGTIVLEQAIAKTEFDAAIKDINDTIGKLSDLSGPVKTNVVAAINSLETRVGDKIGDTTTLETTAKTNLVSAINEVYDDLNQYEDDVADTTAGKGSALVGFKGTTGANSIIDIAAGTVENSLASVITQTDAEFKSQSDTLGKLKTNINNSKYKVETTSAATSHSITHNLHSQFVDVMVWAQDPVDSKWRNDVLCVTIVDADTITIDCTEALNVRVIVRSAEDITLA